MRYALFAWLALASALRPSAVAHPRLRTLRVGETVAAGPGSITRLATRPASFLLRGALRTVDCASLVDAAVAAGFGEAATASGDAAVDRPGCAVAWVAPPPALTAFIAGLFLTDEARAAPGSGCEDFQVVRYDAGGSYALHHDSSAEAPRALTVLYYLNGVGNTWLPLADGAGDPPERLDAAFARAAAADPSADGVRTRDPAPGDALVFFNFDAATGDPDWTAVHTALPAALDVGEKWIANHWFRVGGILGAAGRDADLELLPAGLSALYPAPLPGPPPSTPMHTIRAAA